MTEEEIGCIGKVRFVSRAAGRRRARQIRGATGNRLHDYRCCFCGAVHLGHAAGQATYLRANPLSPTGASPVKESAA